MDLNEAYNCGKNSDVVSYSDDELDKQIEILQLVISYLNGRGDSAIVISSLRRDLESFNNFKREREFQCSILIPSIVLGQVKR